MILHILDSFSFLPFGLNMLVLLAFLCFGIFVIVDIILSVLYVIRTVKKLFL